MGEGDGGAASASNSVMVSLKAPTGNTELVGLGYGSRHLGYGRRHPEVGTLNPERSYAAQGIAKGATLKTKSVSSPHPEPKRKDPKHVYAFTCSD